MIDALAIIGGFGVIGIAVLVLGYFLLMWITGDGDG